MENKSLGRRERRVYFVLWLVGFVSWLGSFALWVFTAGASLWIWVGFAGIITAVVFGMAIRYDNHVWPLSLWLDSRAD